MDLVLADRRADLSPSSPRVEAGAGEYEIARIQSNGITEGELLSWIEVEAQRVSRAFRLSATGEDSVRGKLALQLASGDLTPSWFRRDGPSLRAFVRSVARQLARAESQTAAERRNVAWEDLGAIPAEFPEAIEAEGQPSDPPDPRTFPSLDEASPEIEASLETLTQRQRDVVRLHVLEGLSLEQTGNGLGITRNAANHAFRSALNALARRSSTRLEVGEQEKN